MIRATCLLLATLMLAACAGIPLSPAPGPAFPRTSNVLAAPPADLAQP